MPTRRRLIPLFSFLLESRAALALALLLPSALLSPWTAAADDNNARLTQSLAQEAKRRGLDELPETRLELAQRDAGIVRPLLSRAITDAIEITDEDLAAQLRIVEKRRVRPRRVRLYNIFKRYPPSTSTNADADAKAEVRRQMEDIRRRLEAGESFQEIARAESHSQTRLQDGLIGNVRPGQLTEVDDIVMALQKGEISDIVERPMGLTLFYCEDILPEKRWTDSELRDWARQILENGLWKGYWAKLEEKLLKDAAPVFHWEAKTPDAGLVDFRGGVLTVGEARLILGDLWTQRSEKLLAPEIRQRRMVREAEIRGLINEEVAARRLQARHEVLATKALAAIVQERLIRPSPAEIEKRYREYPEHYVWPPEYQLGVLALPLDPNDPRPAYKLGARIVQDLDNGTLSFAEAAQRHSEHPTAVTGGDAGWVTRWNLPRRFGLSVLQTVLDMKPGERSDLIAESSHLWLVELRGFREERPATLDEARKMIDNEIGNERVERLQDEVVAEWQEKLGITSEGRK